MKELMIIKKQLSHTDLSISELSLGTVKFGRNQSVKYPSSFDLPSDDALKNLLSLSCELGITTLDTAPAYGYAEQRLGKLLKGQRQSFEIISKAGELYDSKHDQSIYNYSTKSLEAQLDHSLRTLNTDYLDVWLLHSNGDDVKNLSDEVIHCFHKAKQAGKVRAIGLSGKTVDGGKLALEHLDTIMMTSNLDFDDEDSLFDLAQSLGKGVLLKKIFNSGWVVNSKDATEKRSRMIQTFEHCFKHSSTASAIIGSINPQHIQDNVSAFVDANNSLQKC